MGELQHIDQGSASTAKSRRGKSVAQRDDAAIISTIAQAARDPNVSIDKMERLMEMQVSMMARIAKKDFSAAMSKMQPELPVIAENGRIEVRDKHDRDKVVQSTSFAQWEDINDAIKPILARHGFALRFKPGMEPDGKVSVTGILSHEGGHEETATMLLPHDGTGSKNAVQAIGSSTSYGKRYVACAMLNISSRLKQDRDDDGAGSGRPTTVNEDQAIDLRELVIATDANLPKFLAIFKVDALDAIPAARFGEALKILKDREAARGGRR